MRTLSETHLQHMAETLARKNAARAEDLLWMADHGETVEGAAKRLEMTVDSLRRWARRHEPETWARIVGNDTVGRIK